MDKENLRHLYIEEKKSSREIAKILDTNKNIILKRLKEYGISIRAKRRVNKGKIIMHDYFYVMKKGYHGANKDGYVPEHRYVVEQHLGRTLKENEVVHHINHNKLDNRIENLKVMNKSEHIRLHHTGLKYSKESREKMSKSAKEKLRNPKNHPMYKDINPLELIELRKNNWMVKDICKLYNIDGVTYHNKIKSLKECM